MHRQINVQTLIYKLALLAEHEITRLITLVAAIAKKLEIEEAQNPEINELSKDVLHEKFMDTMENHKENREGIFNN